MRKRGQSKAAMDRAAWKRLVSAGQASVVPGIRAADSARAARLASARDAALERLKEWYADRYEDPHGVALGILEEAVRALLAAEAEGHENKENES